MKKKLILLALLIVTNITNIQARANFNSGNFQPEEEQNTPLSLLDKIHQLYASQPTNQLKLRVINHLLDQSTITLEEKIANIQALQRVIDADISLHSGWFWNAPEDQFQIDWLYERQAHIKKQLDELQWQAKSFGYKTTVQAAKYMSIYFGIILAAYLSQGQLAKITGNTDFYGFGEIAMMPISQIISLATNAIIVTTNSLTGPTAQKIAGGLYSGTMAVGKTATEYITDAATVIGTQAPKAIQSGVHAVAENLANLTEQAKPTKGFNFTTPDAYN
ncbi:hypothetical protein KBC04_03975 [Candidatus Babeliales bacterium]|nr:hypothetical protein [Candidatus Babeliales bacterium]MBP9843346.1 hypothetical protein [Candidatus Babeliales bacterium]